MEKITGLLCWFRSSLRKSGIRAGFLFFLLSAVVAVAAPVDAAKARLFAERWLQAVDQPLGAAFSAQSSIASVAPITDSLGGTIAYNVTLSPSGYVIISADDRLQPVITFSGNGSYDDNPANPLRGLLLTDLRARLAAVAQLAPEGPAVRGVDPVEPPPAVLENKSAWESFTGPATRAAATDVVAEVWVGSFVKSKWDQGGGIYNYYTPTIYANSYTFQEPGNPDNIVCGCVATAQAQVMRYFQWPQKGVGVKQGNAAVYLRDMVANPDPILFTMNLRGGNGVGGPYNWDLMSLSPTGDEDLETLQQIGALCLDAGLSVGMSYNMENKNQSGAASSAASYTGFFKYAGAGSPGGAAGARANLDARRPVVLSSNTVDLTVGHAFLTDGYGRIDGRWYYHLNLGWGGKANGWYSFEEHLLLGGSPYRNEIGFEIGNIYRQKLQANEKIDNAGRIISGRITDANGLPVAGVKVSIRKESQAEGKVWQQMLVWNEPLDPVATPVYKDWEGAAPGADKYRHWTDANGIWAIDKVEDGNYVIQFEKEGLEFLGTTNINVNKNHWGLNFIASPAGGLLSLDNWWYDGALLYLEFDRAIGNVQVDLSKIQVGGTALTGATVYQSDASEIMVIDTAGLAITLDDTSVVTIESGFLSIDVDGNHEYDGQAGINNLPPINAVAAKNIVMGTPPAFASAVTAITRVGDFAQTGSEIKFTVAGTGLANMTLQDFHLRVSSSGCRAVSVPSVSISAWDANSGQLTLQVGAGEGLVRVDYIPSSGNTPFLQGETCHVDNAGPAIIAAKLSGDNTYVTLTWNEPAGKNEDAETRKIADLPGMVCYNGTPGDADFAIWREKLGNSNGTFDPPDTYGPVDEVLFGCEDVASGTSGETIDKIQGTKEALGATVTVDLGQFMYVDFNENGVLDAQDMIFIKVRKDYAEMGAGSALTPGDDYYIAEFDPDADFDRRTVLGPKKTPLPSAKVPAIRLKNASFRYSYSDEDLPVWDLDNETKEEFFVRFNTWWGKLSTSGNGAWTDYSPAENNGYQAVDTVLFGAPADGAAGTVLAGSTYEDTLYFIDVRGNNDLDNNDFVWLDGGSVAGAYDDGDTVLSTLQPGTFSVKASLTPDSLWVLLHANGGTVENVSIDKITDKNGNPTGVALRQMRVYLKYTPALENHSNVDKNATYANRDLADTGGVPAGVETIEIKPYADAAYDALGNVASEGNTSGELLLYKSNRPRLKKAVVSYDNCSVMLQFNKRIYGNSQGILGNYLATAALMIQKIKDKDNITSANVEVYVVYDDESEEELDIQSGGTATRRDVIYQLGANYFEVIFDSIEDRVPENLRKLNMIGGYNGKTPVSLRIELSGIYDFEGEALIDDEITLPLWPAYKPGYASLPPKMFTNAKGAYTQIVLNAQQTALYVEAPSTESPGAKLANTLPAGSEQGVANDGAIDYYGVWYRDLDGDGRVDAVDLRFKNPYYLDETKHANLYVNEAAISRFRVYVQNNDPEDLDDEDMRYYPPDKEGMDWDADYGGWADYPLNTQPRWNRYNERLGYNLLWPDNFRANWDVVDIIDHELIINKYPYPRERYTTLRLTLNQNQVAPRTHGDRLVMVTYAAPRYKNLAASVDAPPVPDTYDGRIYGDKPPLKKFEKTPATDPKTYHNELLDTDAKVGYWGNADEEAGIYWRYDRSNLGSAQHAGHVDAYFIVDSFGPVMAWDGAQSSLISAVAWRSTPYPKAGETGLDDACGYEYFDLTFSEPIAWAEDHALSVNSVSSGYKDSAAFDGYMYGAWGATVIAPNTVRFKTAGSWRTENFALKGYIIDDNPGFRDRYVGLFLDGSDASLHYNKYRQHRGAAIGVKPVDSRYRVLSQDDSVDMLMIKRLGGENDRIENRVWDVEKNILDSSTFSQSVNQVSLKAIAQGGAYNNTSTSWLEDGVNIGNATDTLLRSPGNATGELLYSLRLNTQVSSPGASLYGAVNALTIRNDTMAGYTTVGQKYTVSPLSLFNAPSPLNRQTGQTTASTPVRAMMSGPVYAMVKVSPCKQNTGSSSPITSYNSIGAVASSRIVAGKYYPVLGIDAAASSGYTLTEVLLRFVDTSHGQFDPAVDLLPLADGAESGVLLVDENAGQIIRMALDGFEWSEWRINVEGLPYREIRLRPTSEVSLPTSGGAAQSFDFTIRIAASENLNLGDSFYVEVPDNGIKLGSYQSKDSKVATWNTPNGTKGYPFTDFLYNDRNGDNRWAAGDAISAAEDAQFVTPLHDGGHPYFTVQKKRILSANGINVRNLYYAKKGSATNPESDPFYGQGGTTSDGIPGLPDFMDVIGSDVDLTYNVSYTPGDDVWYDIGGIPGVYDAGIDIPLFGNADKFPLPWSNSEVGARSAQMRGAAPANAIAAIESSSGIRPIAAPSNGPVAMVGLDMQDAGRGFGPRYILEGALLVETISKNITGGEYLLYYQAESKKLRWKDADATAIMISATTVGERVILQDKAGETFVVVRRLSGALPTADVNIPFVVSSDVDRDIQQPALITGVRVLAVGRGNAVGTAPELRRQGASLGWADGTLVDVSAGGIFVLNPGSADYLVIEVTVPGGAGSEALKIYSSEGRAIAPFLNISGLEIMAVSDMVPQGFHTFSYNGAGVLSWGSGAPAEISGPLSIVYGDGTHQDFPRNYVVVRRTAAALPAEAVTDSLFINQTQLLRVAVNLRNVRDFTPTHITAIDDTENSGISLWWDANADGKFNAGDMFVKLLEKPVLQGSAGNYNCVLTPDPAWLTAWLSCPQDSSYATRGSNFFVCVNTTVDMSYGDQFSVTARFFEPSEPDYVTGGHCFATGSSGTVTCTSITNTAYKKLTHPGQTIDAETTVGLISINHFMGADLGLPVYMTEVKLDVFGDSASFDPEMVFAPMDAEQVNRRGILLFVDSNSNGIFDPNTDRVIPCHINVSETAGKWTYTLIPEVIDEDVYVPGTSDTRPDHFIAIRLSEKLPFGISFSAGMNEDYVTYNTGVGNAASSIRTDILTSTISSKYQDLLDARMVSATTGLSINRIGPAVRSDYHKITFGYNPNNGHYTLSWGGYSVEIDIGKVGTYTIGNEATGNFITVTFDPVAFFREDTLVASPSGLPPEDIKLGDKLVSLAGQTKLTYFDANANGRYDHGETIVYNGAERLYGDEAVASAVTAFSAADGLAFFSEDGSADFTWTAAADFDAIFHDSDGVYTLPWMALTVDVDNYVTAGLGGAPGISEGTGLISAARVSLPANTDLTGTSTDYELDSPLFLYFIKETEDGLGYRHGEDIVVARPRAGTNIGALTLVAADKIVYDPAYMLLEEDEVYVRPANGKTLHQFAAEDYLRFKANTLGTATYAQGQALFLSYNDTYQAPSFDWSIRVDKKRLIRRYNPLAMKPFDTAESALTALVGLDIANSGATDVKLTSLTVRFRNVSNFSTTDLRTLSTDVNSGVQLWRDVDGNGIFNPAIDKLVSLSGTPNWLNDGTDNYLTFSLAADNAISNAEVDGLYDFFVVVQPSESANSKQSVDNGDRFRVIIRNTDVVLNKTLNKSASITTDSITIDSKAPELVADNNGNTVFIADTDQDGYLERVVMTFHEELQPGLFDDLGIWQFEDAETGASLTVTAADLSEDYHTVTLTLAGNDLGSSSGKLRLKVTYDKNAAMLDWAGNPVELRIDATITEAGSQISNYLLSSDTALPRIVHTGVIHSAANYSPDHIVKGTDFYFRDRNGNGAWDAGENIWQGTAVYDADCTIIWNGGSIEHPAAWNTVAGYQGISLDNLYFCDKNEDGQWNRDEFLWIDLGDTLETLGLYDEDVDIAVPLKRTEEIAVLDSDRDGRLDALRVYFSEALKDSTMDGYKATMDSFAAGKWSLVDRGNLTAWRQGLNDEYPDAQNNDLLYFSFAPSIAADTGTLPVLVLAAGETLADPEGNRLNGGAASAAGTLVLNDQAPPVLLEVFSSAKVEKVGADYVLPAGTTLTLRFSEDVFEYLQQPNLADRCTGLELSVDGGGNWFALSDKLGAGSDLSVQGDCIVITFGTETNDWPQTGVKFRLLAPANADSVFGDKVGHNPLPVPEMLVPTLDAPDPTRFVTPLAGSYIRNNSDDLAVEVHWGDNPFDAEPGTLRVYRGRAAIAEELLHEFPIADLSDLNESNGVVDLTGWAEPGQYAYLLELTYVSGGTDKTISSAFFYAAEADIETFALAVNDGPNVGEDIDQVLYTAGKLSANWEDFAAANGRPQAVKYEFTFAIEGENPVTWTETHVTFGDKDIDLSGETGKVYIAWVRAYDQNDVLIAQANSDGVTIVDVLSDTKAPVVVYVNEGANQGVDIDESSVTTSLSYNLKIEDNADPGDVGIASYEVRLLRDSSVWSLDSSSKQLDAGRTGFAATTVNGQAWIIGGFDGNRALTTVNYTPLNQDGVWESREWAVLTTGSLNTGRSDFAFVKLQNGDLLAVGGNNGANSYYNSFEYFSMNSRTWTILGSHNALKRAGAKAVEVSENVVWIIGGRNAAGPQGSIVEIDLSGAAPAIAELGIGLSEVRDNLQVALQTRSNGKKYLLAIGGKTGFGASTTMFNTVDVFDVEEETASIAHLNTGRYQAALVTVPVAGAEEVWVLGGYGDGLTCLDSVECIGANGAITGKPALSSPRAEFAAIWLPESESLLAVGGVIDDFGTATAGVEQLTYGGAAWKVLSPLTRTAGVIGHALAKVGFGDLTRLVVFGGIDGNYNFLKGSESRKLLEVVRDWQEIALNTPLPDSVETTGNFTGLNLQDGATYYFQVRATDGAGNTSTITGSNGVLIDTALTRATITCNDIPAGGETAENQYLVTIGGDGVLSYKYRLLLNAVEVSAWSASWTNVSQNLSLELPDLGEYRLEVIGKSASKEQSPADPTMVSWTVAAPKAIIAGGLPAEGGNTYATATTVIVAGAGVREYKYKLDGGEWSDKIAVSATIDLSGLAVGEHTLSLLGYSFSNSQNVGAPTMRTWNVLATGLTLEFSPSLPAENAQGMIVTASDQFEVRVQDPNYPDNDDLDFYIYELWLDGAKIDGAGSEVDGVAIANAIELNDLVPGDYVLKVRAHTESTDTWQPLFTEQPFRVAVLGEAAFVPGLAVADVDSYAVTVDLNGLTNYKYMLLKQLPNDVTEEIIPETAVAVASEDDLSFNLGPLEPGSYILKLWGGDGFFAGIYQPEALEYALAVTQTTPIGEVLTVTLECDKELVDYNNDDTVEVTATFSEKLMAEPTAADFTLAGAQITNVEKTDDKNYKLTLAPVFAAGANQVLSTVRLDAGKVFGYFTGNGNKVSNKIEVLFYRQAIINLSLLAEPADGIELNENVNIQVMVQSQDRFKGGDFVLKFDKAKFRLVVTEEMKLKDKDGNLLYDEKGTQRLDGKKILDDKFNELATVADYVYDADDTIIGLRLAGAATTGVNVSEPTVYAALSFQAIGAGLGADSDFDLEPGLSGLLTSTYGLFEPDSPVVAYGNCQVPVEFVPAILSIAFEPATVSEGGTTDMVLNLSYPLEYSLKVTINGTDYIIPENTTTVSFAVAQADDNVLNGDRTVVYTATAVDSDEHVTSLDGVEATLLVTDDEAALLTFSVVDPVLGAPINEVAEGDTFHLKASLPDGVMAASAAKFSLNVGGTAIAGSDYAIQSNLVIAAGASAGHVEITTYADGIIDAGKKITVVIAGVTVGTKPASTFVAPEAMTVTITNTDTIDGDIDGDGVVDLDDLLVFLNNWMLPVTEENANCDFNDDGKIDLDDLLILLNNWTPDGTRSGTRSGIRGDAIANVNIRLQEKTGKTSVALNETVTIQAFVSTTWQGGINGGRVDVNYTAGVLSFDGVFDHATVVRNFNSLPTQGTLHDADGLIDNIGGANIAGMAYDTEVLFLEFTLEAATLGTGTATVSIGDDFNFSTPSGGPKTSDGSMSVSIANSLTFTVTDPNAPTPEQPEFALAFETTYTAGTRASDKAELILGMLNGASFDITDPQDSLAGPEFEGVYYVAFNEEGRNAPLKWDFRGLSDAETWNVIGRLPGGGRLKLDWALSLAGTDPDYSMPEYFDFSIVFPTGGEIDMRSAEDKYIEFTNEGEDDMIFTFAVKVVKHVDKVSHTYRLYGGWNLIGVPFALDENSHALLAALEPMGYDPATSAYVTDVNQFVPGKAYWVHVSDDLLIEGVYNMTLRGTEVEDAYVQVSAGWNLLSPLYHSRLDNPTSATIPTVWYWTPQGYRWLLPANNPALGVGYWFYSETATTIWPTF